jgi:branched-chain amino acid transport system ATP-binding protein
VLGERIDKLTPDRRMRKGLALVQSEKRIFRRLTVEQNLRLGWYVRRGDRDGYRVALAGAFERFPMLRDRARAQAGLLSGGQQQMLAIAQALMPNPAIIMLDEPTAGLAPGIARQVLDAIAKLKSEGKAILLVEQAVLTALPIADHIGVMTQGQLGLSVPADEIGDISQIQHLYLGTRNETTG